MLYITALSIATEINMILKHKPTVAIVVKTENTFYYGWEVHIRNSQDLLKEYEQKKSILRPLLPDND